MKIRTARKIISEQNREARRAWEEGRPMRRRYSGFQHIRAIITENKHLNIPIIATNPDGTRERITMGGAANRAMQRIEREMRTMQIDCTDNTQAYETD